MKKTLYLLLSFAFSIGFAQNNETRIQTIKNQLEILATDNTALTEMVKTEINVSNITLSNFLLAVSEVHKININLATDLNDISIVNKFSNVNVSDLLVFLCKEYDLTIDFTGNILSVKKHLPPTEKLQERTIPIIFTPSENTISIDAKEDKLYDVFKRIMDESGKNLVFTPGMENKVLTSYLKHVPFDAAMDKLAIANNLFVEITKDGFYVFEDATLTNIANGKPQGSRRNST